MRNRFFRDVKEYSYLIRYMAKTGLRAEVANSYLNWIWWVLEPLASMLIYFCIFGRLLGRDQPYYVAFVYTGTLLWSYFDRCMLYAVQAVRLNRDIVTKTYVPKPVLILSNMLFNDCKMLISAAILALVMAVQRVAVSPCMLYILPVLLLMHLLTFGTGMILMHFGVFVDDLVHALRIGMRILFYASGVFYDLRKVLPEPWGGLLLRVNPIAFVISSARNSLLYAETPDAAALGAWFAIAALLCFAGIKISYAYENTYVKII